METAVAARMRTSAGSAVTRASARRDAGGGPFFVCRTDPTNPTETVYLSHRSHGSHRYSFLCGAMGRGMMGEIKFSGP